MGSAGSSNERFPGSRRPIEQHTLWRFDPNLLEPVLVSYGQNYGFYQLLYLFVQPTYVLVVFARLLVHLHCLHSRVVLWWQGIQHQVAIFVDPY